MALKTPSITKDQAKEELLKVANLLNKVPTRSEFFKYKALKGCYKTSIRMLFPVGGYIELLIYSGFNKTIRVTSRVETSCGFCNKPMKSKYSEINKSKSKLVFCSSSCSCSYHNRNKSHGVRRSKLENFLEDKLISLYPNLEFRFNDIKTIGMELDIYIPSLNLSFELNGIVHYKPIYGEFKFSKIKYNDLLKLEKCRDNNISLTVINTSCQKIFTENSSKVFLNTITDIINGASGRN